MAQETAVCNVSRLDSCWLNHNLLIYTKTVSCWWFQEEGVHHISLDFNITNLSYCLNGIYSAKNTDNVQIHICAHSINLQSR